MQHLSFHLKKSFAHKHLGKQAIGACVMHALHVRFPEYVFDGFVRFDTLIVYVSHPYHKMELFRQKAELLQIANQALEKIGYTTILHKCIVR